MALLDGKYIEDNSIPFGKLIGQPVSQIDFDNALAQEVRDRNAAIATTEENLIVQIQAGVGVEGAAYAPFHPFPGAENSPLVVDLSKSMGTTDYVVVIQPCVKSDAAGISQQGIPSELSNIGTIGYRIVDDQNVAVYNTGASTDKESPDQPVVGFTILAFRKTYITPEDPSPIDPDSQIVPRNTSDEEVQSRIVAATAPLVKKSELESLTDQEIDNMF